jgi:hypothetical protein
MVVVGGWWLPFYGVDRWNIRAAGTGYAISSGRQADS